MALMNTKKQWGWLNISIHWLVALVVPSLFALGWWMTELNYYSDWYRKGPDLHKSIGITLALVMIVRTLIRLSSPTPATLDSHKPWERKLGHLMHLALYILLFALFISGYLISTADGRSISVFGLFEVPATIQGIDKQEDIAGDIHWYVACVVMGMVALHAGAAIKHHFIDKDATLTRMLGKKTD